MRTARLVAVAVARRAGVADELLDEVRLAIGEACTRAVALHRRHGLADLIDGRDERRRPVHGPGGRPGPDRGGRGDPGETTAAIMAQVAAETGRADRRGRCHRRGRPRPARRPGRRTSACRRPRTASAPRSGCPGRSAADHRLHVRSRHAIRRRSPAAVHRPGWPISSCVTAVTGDVTAGHAGAARCDRQSRCDARSTDPRVTGTTAATVASPPRR